MHEQARPAVIRESRRAPWLAVSVVCFGAFMGQLDTSILMLPRAWGDRQRGFGISLMALALHLGTQSSQAGNYGYAVHHGYPGAEQARPAFIVLAVVAATAAAIAVVGRSRRADR